MIDGISSVLVLGGIAAMFVGDYLKDSSADNLTLAGMSLAVGTVMEWAGMAAVLIGVTLGVVSFYL